MTERLTEAWYDDMEQFDRYAPKSPNIEINCGGDDFQRIIDKLAEYETAEEEGRLMVLPCKVGDTVYIIDDIDFTYDREAVVTEIDIDSDCIAIMIQDKDSVGSSGYDISDFGETIFLTREEAEKALEEMKRAMK